MKKHAKHMLMLTLLILAASMIKDTICAAEEYDMHGWGINDPYNQHFDVTKYEKFRAWVVGFRTGPPLPGMSPGTIMIVRDGNRLIDVHICPAWFVGAGDIGVKIGDRVKIKGCRVKIDGKDIFMASKIKRGGTPDWMATPR